MELVLWLAAVMTMLLHSSQAMCADGGREGDIRVIGVHTTNLVAGRIEICAQQVWRAVCHGNWDMADARVVCRQLGFLAEGALFCRNSCFGSNSQPGQYNFDCDGHESKLEECQPPPTNNPTCGEGAGVVCTRNTVPSGVGNCSITLSPEPCTTMVETDSIEMTTDSIEMTVTEMDSMATVATGDMAAGTAEESCPSLPALASGLGGLSLLLMILLVGVVIGWTLSCHNKKGQPQHLEKDSETRAYENPAYGQALSPNHNAWESGGKEEQEVTYDVPPSPSQCSSIQDPEYSVVKHM